MSPSLRLPRLRGLARRATIEETSSAETETAASNGTIAESELVAAERTEAWAAPQPTEMPEVPAPEPAAPAAEMIDGPELPVERPAESPELEPEPDVPRATVADGIAFLAAYRHAVLSWVAEDGYPMNVDVEIDVKTAEGTVRFGEPAGFGIEPGTPVAITGSHVRPIPEGGFDERSHVTVWGPASARPRGRFAVSPSRVWVSGEHDLPLTLSYDRRLPQALRYYEADSVARGVYTRPRLSGRLAIFRAAHAPFLRATFVPLVLGIAVALRAGVFDLVTALVTLAIAGAVHLGLNIANGLFDLLHNPSERGRDRVRSGGALGALREAIADIRGMPVEAISCYAAAAALGVLLVLMRSSPELILLGAAGILLAGAYRTPPLRLADRGLGELAAAVGFGPVLLLGAYAAQSRGPLSTEAVVLSVPLGLLAGLIVFVDEIPNRAGDARAGRLTLPVRWSKALAIRGFELATAGTFAVLAVGVAAGRLPIPALIALLAIPLARRVRADLIRHYVSPYELTTAVAANVQLHVNVGLLLGAGYALAIADQVFLSRAPFLW